MNFSVACFRSQAAAGFIFALNCIEATSSRFTTETPPRMPPLKTLIFPTGEERGEKLSWVPALREQG